MNMTKPNDQDDFLTKWEKTSDKYHKWYMKNLKIMFKKIGKFIPILIGYSFMSWMFIGLYDSVGFDKTLIILLVGVLWYGIRQRVQ